MTNVKVLLNNMFPAGICEMICDYNLHCSKCLDLHRKEAEFLKKNIVAKILTRPEQQILFFKECMNFSYQKQIKQTFMFSRENLTKC